MQFRVVTLNLEQDHKRWSERLPLMSAVGVGGAGGEASKLCGALAMRVLGIDPRVTELPPGMSDLATPSGWGSAWTKPISRS